MTKFRVLLASALLVSAATAVATGELQSQVTLTVEGMTCASCPITVKRLLANVPGVSEASVNYKTREAQVWFDPDKVQADQLARAVTDIGFPAKVKK